MGRTRRRSTPSRTSRRVPAPSGSPQAASPTLRVGPRAAQGVKEGGRIASAPEPRLGSTTTLPDGCGRTWVSRRTASPLPLCEADFAERLVARLTSLTVSSRVSSPAAILPTSSLRAPSSSIFATSAAAEGGDGPGIDLILEVAGQG